MNISTDFDLCLKCNSSKIRKKITYPVKIVLILSKTEVSKLFEILVR